MPFELSIKVDYCPSWKTWEGVREIVQNGMDAHSDGHTMTIKHYPATNRLVVSNQGVKLDKDVWLLGETTKAYRSDQIGQFGEGLDIGVLALLRDGKSVKIINDDESWTPYLAVSKKFSKENKDVFTLHVKTHKRQEGIGAFHVTIEPITKEEWADISVNFLPIQEEGFKPRMLLEPQYAGKLFVKGIFVQKTSTKYGYDLPGLRIDRDRKMADRYDIFHSMGFLFSTQEPIILKTYVVPMLFNDDSDIECFEKGYGEGAVREMADYVVSEFFLRHGTSAHPVETQEQATILGHFNIVGIVTTKGLRRVLQANLGTFEERRTRACEAGIVEHNINDLTEQEQENWLKAYYLVEEELPRHNLTSLKGRTKIVTFMGQEFSGRTDLLGGPIEIAREILVSFEKTLGTLVHEAAHEMGEDGEKEHERAIQNIFSGIVERALQTNISE